MLKDRRLCTCYFRLLKVWSGNERVDHTNISIGALNHIQYLVYCLLFPKINGIEMLGGSFFHLMKGMDHFPPSLFF